MDTQIDNRAISANNLKNKILNESNAATLDGLFTSTNAFLDRLPTILKEIDSSIEAFPQMVSNLLKRYPHLPAIVGYGFLAFISIYLGLAVCAALNDIPVLGSLLEWVEFTYVVWFSIRHLLFETQGDRLKINFQYRVLNGAIALQNLDF
ncbi:MAG: CAAD domain-containing protein [Prochloraceae cyanobacterium]